MIKISDVNIGPKLMGGFALVLILAVMQGLFSLYQLGAVNRQAQEIATMDIPSVALSGAINTSAANIRVELLRHVMESDETKKKQIEEALTKLDGQMAKQQAAYVSLATSEEGKKVYDTFLAEWKKVLYVRNQAMEFSRSGDAESAQAQLTKGAKAFAALSVALENLVQLNQTKAGAAGQSIEATHGRANITTFSALIVMVGLGLLIGWLLSRSLAKGVGQAAAVAQQVADGNLCNAVPVGGRDELGQMLQALDAMQTHLARTVSGVRQGSEGVATASAEIAQGNHDLSARTEHQASALEQTAASMEELGATVKQNADSARHANQLAMSASAVAIRGGEVVQRVVETMKGINESSRKIADIISVIDGIAFQTNILALNAAVEAARAGEQGRGFAVVASEVRSLAGRSAEAAKEIKLLIGASVQRVEQGGALVDQAGVTMSEVVSSIQRVTDIMGEISAASSEQATGVAQVGEAVTQMDQVTQQNAALVEEMAAAASSLKSQAEDLVQSVAVFKLNEQHVRLLA